MSEQLNEQMKFAIIGTSSAGKTTLCLQILANLKRLGVLVDTVLQQDRRLSFDRAKLETHVEAQYVVIFNMVVVESEMLLRNATDILVCDRSVLDFYAYYETMYGRSEYLWNFVKNWCETYSCLYYVQPLEYHDDGNRPGNEFRLEVDRTLCSLIEELRAEGHVTILSIDRNSIYSDILTRLNRKLTDEELSFIPLVLQQDCLIGGSYAFNRATKYSDIDIYILDTYVGNCPELNSLLRGVFGANMEVRKVPKQIWDYYVKGEFKLLRYDTNTSLEETCTQVSNKFPLSKFPN